MSYSIVKNLKEILNKSTIPATTSMRRPKGTGQWYLEKRIKTHPIYNKNDLELMICGRESFASIAASIEEAKTSIDIVLWGFDPAMELVRKPAPWGKRHTETYGDLLLRKAKSGVAVRLLIWKDEIGSYKQGNLVGYISPSLNHTPKGQERRRLLNCINWWKTVQSDLKANIEIRTRSMPVSDAKNSLNKNFPSWDQGIAEKILKEWFATHHQKPILIDYENPDPAKAVGYVMGLNSLTAYWDSSEHVFHDARREIDWKNDPVGNTVVMPLRDYAIKVKGEVLYSLNQNFARAWDRANHEMGRKLPAVSSARSKITSEQLAKDCKRGQRCQIVRTQPQENDNTAWESYQLALANAVNYIYVENQYFFLPEWAQGLKEIRKANIEGWQKAGVPKAKINPLKIFIVIPHPEEDGMVPRTYSTVAELGAGDQFDKYQGLVNDSLKGQNQSPKVPSSNDNLEQMAFPFKLIKHAVKEEFRGEDVKDNVRYANIAYFRKEMKDLGIDVLVAMLESFDTSNHTKSKDEKKRYREIYIHSKFMLVDDTFTTLGSANINARSMAGDSELNLITEENQFTQSARKRVWKNLAGESLDGGYGAINKIYETHFNWLSRMDNNFNGKKKCQPFAEDGFIVPFHDSRGSAIRLA